MKKRLQCAALILFLGLLLIPCSSGAEIYVERVGKGRIDWSNGVVEATGIGTPPRKTANRARARALALRQAALLARRNILELLKTLRIDSRHLARDIVLKNISFDEKVKTLIFHTGEVETFFLPGNRVKRTITVGIRGSMADVLLPGSVREIEHIKGGIPNKKTGLPVVPDKKAFTGLVVDCRGLKVKPAMVPRILDEDGNEVYGPAIVGRRYALRKGVAEYMKKLNDALHDPRIGENPLLVKAVRASGAASCDIVISNSDAGRIVGAPANLGFLRKACVIVVLD